ncbi:response regulator [Sulfurimonas sp.]|uniref:response regulator n=1 Tax=Sulfurimonas sp. TaxID=2022749 RepID=UPI003566F06E
MITVSKLKEYAADIRVLYVEDDKAIQHEIHDFLGRFFPTIILADNGEEGLQLYKTGHYDIVISDINMPKMNGIEMVNAIKEINEEQKVIITSAYNEPKYLMELIDNGVDKFVLKPFNNKQFLHVLYKISEYIYNKKQNQLLQKEISKKMSQIETIVNMIEHGIVVIDHYRVTQVNEQFLKMAGYDTQEEFYQEISNVSSLFEPHKGYIDVNTNKELIEVLESSREEIHKVIMKIDLKENIYLLKHKKVPNEDKYVISFTDITEEEELVNINTKTGLPNIFAMTSDIEYRIAKGIEFVVDLVRIENIDKMVKWHGREVRNHVDENVGGILKKEKETLDENGVFAAYYGHNKFVFVREKDKKDIVDAAIRKIGYISIADDKENIKRDKSSIFYMPIQNSIEVKVTAKIDDLLKEIEAKLENMIV